MRLTPAVKPMLMLMNVSTCLGVRRFMACLLFDDDKFAAIFGYLCAKRRFALCLCFAVVELVEFHAVLRCALLNTVQTYEQIKHNASIFFLYRDIFIFSGRSSECKCLYSRGVMANKMMSHTVASSDSAMTADREGTAQP